METTTIKFFVTILKENRNPTLNIMKINSTNKLCSVFSSYSFHILNQNLFLSSWSDNVFMSDRQHLIHCSLYLTRAPYLSVIFHSWGIILIHGYNVKKKEKGIFMLWKIMLKVYLNLARVKFSQYLNYVFYLFAYVNKVKYQWHFGFIFRSNVT